MKGRCVHYTGMGKDCCEAGVNYITAFGPREAIYLRLPCVAVKDRKGNVAGQCDKLRMPTAEEIAADEAEWQALFAKQLKVMEAIAEWRKKPWGKNAVRDCPACGGVGTLQLSQSAYNGHVHGRCATSGCVSWME